MGAPSQRDDRDAGGNHREGQPGRQADRSRRPVAGRAARGMGTRDPRHHFLRSGDDGPRRGPLAKAGQEEARGDVFGQNVISLIVPGAERDAEFAVLGGNEDEDAVVAFAVAETPDAVMGRPPGAESKPELFSLGNSDASSLDSSCLSFGTRGE